MAEPGSELEFDSKAQSLNSQCCITRNMTLNPLPFNSYQDPGVGDNTHKVHPMDMQSTHFSDSHKRLKA